MRAVVFDAYGPPDVLRLEEVEIPPPGEGHIQVRVEAAAVAAGDWHLLRGDPFLVRLVFGLTRPRIRTLGSAVAGTVERVGPGVTRFRPGDEVMGDLSDAGFGGFAELVTAPEGAFVPKPPSLSFVDGAALTGSAVTALQGLRDHGRVQPRERVLVNGASGGVGTFAVQLARVLGAEVTGVCSTRNVELVRSLGADHVVDYTREDFAAAGPRYDVILDAAAYRPLKDHLRALRPGGRYVLVGGDMRRMLAVMIKGPWVSRASGKRATTFVTRGNPSDLAAIASLAVEGKIRPALDRTYALAQVPEAVRYLETGRARGKVVVLPHA